MYIYIYIYIYTHVYKYCNNDNCERNACIMSMHASLKVLRALAHVALRAYVMP